MQVVLAGFCGRFITGRAGDPGNGGQVPRRCFGHRRVLTLLQELHVVDDPGTSQVGAEECNEGCRGCGDVGM